MITPLAKICGLTRREDARDAEMHGAHYLGAILAGGPRLLTIPQAHHVLGPRRHGVQRVAVFGDQTARDVIDTAAVLDLDVIQLHGHRTVQEVRQIARDSGRTVWPVLRVVGVVLPDEAAALAEAAGALVLDAHVVGQLGGTGVALDWSGLVAAVDGLRQAVGPFTLVLAGGLRPENVTEAVRLLSPQVVDVSSGVESAPGVKDPVRLQQFVQAVRGIAEKSQ